MLARVPCWTSLPSCFGRRIVFLVCAGLCALLCVSLHRRISALRLTFVSLVCALVCAAELFVRCLALLAHCGCSSSVGRPGLSRSLASFSPPVFCDWSLVLPVVCALSAAWFVLSRCCGSSPRLSRVSSLSVVFARVCWLFVSSPGVVVSPRGLLCGLCPVIAFVPRSVVRLVVCRLLFVSSNRWRWFVGALGSLGPSVGAPHVGRRRAAFVQSVVALGPARGCDSVI